VVRPRILRRGLQRAAVGIVLLCAGCVRFGYGPAGGDGRPSTDLTGQGPKDHASAPDMRSERGPRSDEGDDPLPDRRAQEGALLDGTTTPDAALVANASHDKCDTPLTIDLGTLGAGSVDVQVDTSGSSSDFSISQCSPFPDVVVALRNAPSMFYTQCVGGAGKLTYGSTDLPQCTQAVTATFVTTCSYSGAVGWPTPAADYVVVFCRDPSLGPATVRFSATKP
jgi:hypothetical protein